MSGGASTFLGQSEPKSSMLASGRRLAITSWNIAAINNNPFEYWITTKENPNYEKLMINIENFLENPGDQDVKVNQVFTQEMFNKLDSRLEGVGWKSVRSYWENEFQDRNIISGFLKGKSLLRMLLQIIFSLLWRKDHSDSNHRYPLLLMR
jgi:hypothetical protein